MRRAWRKSAATVPVLAGDVPEAELRERLLHGEIEQRLEEADERERRGIDAEVVEPEHAGRDDRPDDAARDGGVNPCSRRRPPPVDAGGHPRECREGFARTDPNGAVPIVARWRPRRSTTRASSGLRTLVDRDAVGALILAAAIPFLFFHERYQPEASVGVGATTIDVRLSDVAVLVVLIAAVVAATRHGIARLGAAHGCGSGEPRCSPGSRSRRSVGLARRRALRRPPRQLLKLVEYGLLALAVPLLVRRSADLTILLGGLVLWAGLP